MAWTPATFRTAFPEFNAYTDAQLQAKLDMAGRQVDTVVFGDRADDAVGFLTAHLLSSSPSAGVARLSKTSPETTYWHLYRALVRQCAGGPWTVGQLPGDEVPEA